MYSSEQGINSNKVVEENSKLEFRHFESGVLGQYTGKMWNKFHSLILLEILNLNYNELTMII